MASAKKYLPLDSAVVKALGDMESPNFTNVYDFEKISIGLEGPFVHWMQENWLIAFYLSTTYVAFVFGGQAYMRTRPAFNLRPLLVVWSAILAVFSIMGAYRAMPDLVHSLRNYSFHHSVCHPDYFYGITGFWSICFTLSKAYELGDTVFIVLRKQHLMFLHWYHHVTVLMYVWHSYAEHSAPGRWFCAMNYTVHAFMYSYYTLRALQFRLPRWISVGITSMQIVQMLVGCSLFFYVQWTKSVGLPCQVSDTNALSGSLMYLSYLVLFTHFFYNSYMRPRRATPSSAAAATTDKQQQQSSQSSSLASGSNVTAVFKSVADIERRGFVVKKDS